MAPDEKHPTPLFDALIMASFPGIDHDHEEQRALLQLHFGACVVGVAARMQKAMLWRGVERSGKSTLQEIMRAMFSRRTLPRCRRTYGITSTTARRSPDTS